MSRDLGTILRRAAREPGAALSYAFARLRGEWYRIWLPLRGRRFTAGRGLQVRGRLDVRGPGRVVLGDRVQVWGTVTPWTYRRDSVIEIGTNTRLGGTRLGCVASITIGRDCILADCRLMDSDFHSVHANRHDDDAPIRVAPIVIEDNVWIAATAGIMPGTTIGRNSVVSFGSVCSGRFPSDVIILGNPARVAGKVPGAEPAAPAPAAPPAADPALRG
ncbi:MAG TPA: acyltransferase [Gemmatimonadaceae bacterium]|nr:acyltransferase [Gemmatimonadaceae bacterium]